MTKEHLEKIYNYLVYLGYVHSWKELANKIEMTPTSISSAKNGDPRYLTSSLFAKINKKFGDVFNVEWWETGEGEMLNEEYTSFSPVGVAKPVEVRTGVNISDVSDQDLKIEILQERYDEAMRYVKKLEADNIVLQETNKRLLDMLERALSGATSSVQSKAQ